MQRMFDHPVPFDEIVHPYDVENRDHAVRNLWGQRVTSLVPTGTDLFIATSAKSPFEWDAKAFPFLAPDKWKSYGKVYRTTMPGHLAAPTRWTDGPTTIEFTIRGPELAVHQDGKPLARTTLIGPMAEEVGRMKALENVTWGDGIYGRFGGASLQGRISGQFRSSSASK
jgi:hypothetical protein